MLCDFHPYMFFLSLLGMSFFFGVPLGAILSSKVNIRAPLYLGIILCTMNIILTFLFLPESLDTSVSKYKEIRWKDANPFGAIKMFSRNRKFAAAAIVYFLLQLAQSGDK